MPHDIELSNAFAWVCPACDKENFVYAVRTTLKDLTEVQFLKMIKDAHLIEDWQETPQDRDSFMSDCGFSDDVFWYTPPAVVKCRRCGMGGMIDLMDYVGICTGHEDDDDTT